MRRVEFIVPQRRFDDVMLYLREQNAIELLDVKEMIKGYGGGVTPTTVSDRLYRLTTIESLISYAEHQLEQSIEEIAKIENVNSPEGRHKLEEIVSTIFQTLKPAEIKFAEPLSELIQAKAMEDAVVKDISNNVASILSTKRDESAIADAITQTLGLKLKAVVRSKRLSYEATSRIEESKRRLKQLKNQLSESSSAHGEYLLVQREVG